MLTSDSGSRDAPGTSWHVIAGNEGSMLSSPCNLKMSALSSEHAYAGEGECVTHGAMN